MQIVAENIGKKFDARWVLKDLSLTIASESRIAVLGNNGSGKSTFLKLLAAYSTPTQGKITWLLNNKAIDREHVSQHLSLAAPLLTLPQQASVEELLDFTQTIKPLAIPNKEALDLFWLTEHKRKKINQLSSGMQQRLKVGLAILQQTHLLFLDEPCTNLDTKGIAWYHKLIDTYTRGKTVVVATNMPESEAPFCQQTYKINS
ncbi:MAG: ABC transporter ATP-binding protein [Luteibaculaceae bacterium]